VLACAQGLYLVEFNRNLVGRFVDSVRSQVLWGQVLHGAKVLTIRFQTAVLPTATDRKDAIAIPA
jgi:hypothetical protein